MGGLRWRVLWVLPAILLVVGWLAWRSSKTARKTEAWRSYFVERGDLRQSVQASGVIDPKNRVEILPPVAGRVDKVLAEQGERFKKGKPLAWMSSTDRAAVLDAALQQGPTVYAHWEKAFRPTPILAPVDGLLIDKAVVEGQTVGGRPIFVMADRLIVRSRVDESDISKISLGQPAAAVADAFPGKPFKGKVSLVDYQSRDAGGVTAYQVELEPEDLPAELRSGMTVKVDFLIRSSTGALLLPLGAVGGASETEVELKVKRVGLPERVKVKLGFSDGSSVVVERGLAAGDEVLVEAPDFGAEPASNPLDPFSRRKK